MSVKSIQVKLVMPGDSEGEGIRRAFAQTHLVHNAGVHYFMENLLLMRQGDVYETRDSLKPDKTDSQYRKELLRFAYEARRRNGVSKKISDDEILALIRKVYEQIVPASIGESGDNQFIARYWLNSLVSKKSIAGLGKSKSGRKSTWTKLPDSDPRKAELKQRAEERKSEQKAAELRPRLKEFGLIPLWPMFRLQSGYQWVGVETKGKAIAWDDDEVTAWERDMFQQALERISGWESWNKRAINRHQKAQEDLKDWEHEHAADFKIWRPIFERYEKNRKQEYEISPLGLKRPFRIGRRMLRGWDRIREKWLAAAKKNSSIPESELVDIAKKWQQAHPREIGDINFISYLAKPENRAVWSGEWDYAAFQAKHNALLFELEDSHPWTIMTLPNPLLHPLWPRLDVPKGTNMNDYGIVRDENGRWRLTLSILFPNSKLLAEKRITLPVAHSGQLDLLRPIEGSPRELVLRDQGTDEEFKGKWGGAGIRLDRDLLGKMKDEKTLRSYSGPVYINLTVDLT
ncbi:MAG: type V CRISPR-associated protein Cas12b, partial [Elusimicrobia bacterium]|nr:type V CRISPR-associated protein Cas12b [Elusimicrobiota bacterium]